MSKLSLTFAEVQLKVDLLMAKFELKSRFQAGEPGIG